MFFSSNRPLKAGGARKDFDIWKVSRKANGQWGEPVNLGDTVNSAKNEFYPSVTKNGDLYFTVEAAYGKGSEDIVLCKKAATGYLSPVSLPEDFNTKFDEFNAFVDPDEQFIIFRALAGQMILEVRATCTSAKKIRTAIGSHAGICQRPSIRKGRTTVLM